jgi:TPR repeat protein
MHILIIAILALAIFAFGFGVNAARSLVRYILALCVAVLGIASAYLGNPPGQANPPNSLAFVIFGYFCLYLAYIIIKSAPIRDQKDSFQSVPVNVISQYKPSLQSTQFISPENSSQEKLPSLLGNKYNEKVKSWYNGMIRDAEMYYGYDGQYDTEILNRIGLSYAFGLNGLPKNGIEAEKWFRLSIKNNKKYAGDGMANLGRLYELGHGVAKNTAQAKSFYRAAEQIYDKYSILINKNNFLGFSCDYDKSDGNFIYESRSCVHIKDPSWEEEDFRNWYILAAEMAEPKAQYWFGYNILKEAHYEQNVFDPPYDLSPAEKNLPWTEKLLVIHDRTSEWAQPAAKQGLVKAQVLLGIAIQGYCAIKEDLNDAKSSFKFTLSDAASWYRKAAEGGDAEGAAQLAKCYVDGKGVPQSDFEASEWFMIAAEKGDAESQKELGYIFLYGKGILKDFIKASNWFEAYLTKNVNDIKSPRISERCEISLEVGSVFCDEKQFSSAEKFFNFTLFYGSKEQPRLVRTALKRLADMNKYGHIASDPVTTASLYKRAAEMGELTSQIEIADMFERGYGFPRDKLQSYKWLLIAQKKYRL